jgi:hypothetical protein
MGTVVGKTRQTTESRDIDIGDNMKFKAIIVLLAVSCTFGAFARAGNVSATAKNISRDAFWVLAISNPLDAVTKLDSVLKRFSSLSPELDLIKQGEKIKAQLGANPFTKEGFDSLGVDPAGTSVIYGIGMDDDDVVAVLKLANPDQFKTKLFEIIKKEGGKFDEKPKKKAGIEIYLVDTGYIGFKDSWCVLQPKPAKKGPKYKHIMAFFRKGKKLVSNPAFKKAIAALPDNQHSWFYLDMKKLAKIADAHLAKELKEALKSADKNSRKGLIKASKQERAQQKKIFKAFNFIQAVLLNIKLEDNSANFEVLFTTTKPGNKIVKKLFPAKASPPTFHDELAKTAIMGGWMSFNLKSVLDLWGKTKFDQGPTLSSVVQNLSKELKKETKIDLLKDIIGELVGPSGFYLLPPDNIEIDPNLAIDKQVMMMLKLGGFAEIKKPAQAFSMIKLFNEFIKKQEIQVEDKTIADASAYIVKPIPGIEIAWGIKGKTVFITMGKNTLDTIVNALPVKAWSKKAPLGHTGQGLLNIGTLSESISSAVNKGIGGNEAMQFRTMIWPMVQGVLAKINNAKFDMNLAKNGIKAVYSLAFNQ